MFVNDAALLSRWSGAAAYVLFSREAQWQWYYFVAWMIVVLGALELLSALVMLVGELSSGGQRIAARGAHLDKLSTLDVAFIAFNRLTAPVFSFHLLQYGVAQADALVSWSTSPLSVLVDTLFVLPMLFIVYDLTYTLFHRALHHGSVYRFVHKHHHRQNAPSRGNIDAVNVHPVKRDKRSMFEFMCCM